MTDGARGRPVAPEVHALDERVGRHDGDRARLARDGRRVVANADLDVRRRGTDPLPEPVDQRQLAEISDGGGHVRGTGRSGRAGL